MVAYSFKERFCEPINLGTKGGTIRNDRRRHARPGEELQLYFGMRTKHCRLIARKTCLSVSEIDLDFRNGQVVLEDEPNWSTPRRLDAFAIFDGFRSWEDMRLFWSITHGAIDRYAGIHIRWGPWPKELLP